LNRPPVAISDRVVTNADSSVTVYAPGVLSNDSDPDGDTLAVTALNSSGTVGAVTAWDADGSFTYDPNGQFEYLPAGNSTSDSFTYMVSDGHGGIDIATVTITINGVNDAPTDINLDNGSVAENQPPGTAVGSFSTTDADTGDTFAYSLVSGEGGGGNGWFMIVGNQLRAAASFDYEANNSYSIRVRTTDSGSLYYEAVFIITIADVYEPPVNNPPVNHAPTAISLDNSSVAENQPSGTTVGSFSTSDPDTGGSFTYTLVSGNGSMDNGSFDISGSNLRTSTIFDYETTNSSSIIVRSTDQGGLWVEEQFTITITDVNDPPVAVDDNATTPQDTPVTINILSNDSDPDNDALAVVSATNGTHGSVVNNGSDVTYTPDDDFTDTDSFNYTITDGNGGTATATVSVDILEPNVETVRFPDEGTAYIGYEDTQGGDFDYNDFGMNMCIQETYADGCLTEINMWFESARKDSGGSHDIHIRRTLSGSTFYSYTIERSTPDQGTETPELTNASGQGNFNIILFDTSHFTSGATVTIHIEIVDGCEPYSETPWDYYDPYMNYRNHAERHIGETQPAVSPLPTYNATYYVPFILVIPVTGWQAPAERQCITSLYPYFDDYYATGSRENWYE
jgi:VCBS repeat-containing protein